MTQLRYILVWSAMLFLVSTVVHSANTDTNTNIDTDTDDMDLASTPVKPSEAAPESPPAIELDAGEETMPSPPEADKDATGTSDNSAATASAPHDTPTPLSITIRGGSSLGAYEAGYLYILTEAIKRNPRYFTPDVLSGASAGTINAVLSVVSLGTPPQDNPLESVYYRIWTQLNFKELIDVDSPMTPPGALSSRHLLWRIAAQLRTEWLRGFKKDFSVVVGISTTRLLPETIITPGGLEIPNQQAKFVFKVSGQGNGTPPSMTNFIWGKPGMEQLLLPFGVDAETDFNVMMQAVFASCGIPIVFPPQPIDYCVASIRENAIPVCGENDMYTDTFVDGGVVDNSPIHLAYQVHKAILNQKTTTPSDIYNNNAQPPTTHASDDDVILLYLDPEHLRYPEQSTPKPDRRWGEMGEHQTYSQGVDLFATLPKFVQGFVSSSRASEIYSLLNTDPHANIQRTENSFAPISAQLSGQFGFMEREILKYDFYLGMHDAENYLRTTVLEYLQRTQDNQILKTDIVLPQDSPAAKNMVAWHPYRCMRAMFDKEGEKDLACTFGYNDGDYLNPPESKNFKILMQVSIDRVYSHCSLLSNTEKIQDELKREKGMCLDAFGAGLHGVPPQVPGVSSIGDNEWHRCIARRDAVTEKEKKRARRRCHYHRKNEDDFQYVTRLMGAYNYWFRDLGLQRDDSSEIRVVIQNELFKILDTYAKKYENIHVSPYSDAPDSTTASTTKSKKNSGDKTLILTLGKPAITFLDYSPPKNILSLLFGRESSLSWSHSQSGWFRLNWNLLQLGGLETLHTRIKSVTFTHAIGFEWQPPWINTAVVQSSLIGRVGYQLSTRGNFTDATCGDRMADSANRCSLPLLQTLMSISFISRIRLELGINCFLPLSKTNLPNHQLNTVFTAAVGFQFLN